MHIVKFKKKINKVILYKLRSNSAFKMRQGKSATMTLT